MRAGFPTGTRALLGAVVLATAALASCGASTSTTTTGVGIVVLAPTTVPADPVASLSRDDLRDEVRSGPETVTVDARDGRTVRVVYRGGPGSCPGARLAVVESIAQVHVVLFVGNAPAGPTACDTPRALHEVTATLDKPIGSREVIWY
jgi:hypothetical protein